MKILQGVYYVTVIIGDYYYIGFITYFVAPSAIMLKQLGVTLYVRGNLAQGRLVAR